MRIHSTMWINLPLSPSQPQRLLLSLTGLCFLANSKSSKNKSQSNQVTAERLLLYSCAATLLLFLLNMSCALFGPARDLETLKELNKALFNGRKGKPQHGEQRPEHSPQALLYTFLPALLFLLPLLLVFGLTSSTGTHGWPSSSPPPPPPHPPASSNAPACLSPMFP